MSECIWRQQKDFDSVVQRARLVLKTSKLVVKSIAFWLSWQTDTKNNQLLLQSYWRYSTVDQPKFKRKIVKNVTDYLKISNRKCQSKDGTLHLLTSWRSIISHQTKIIERVWEKPMEYFCLQ